MMKGEICFAALIGQMLVKNAMYGAPVVRMKIAPVVRVVLGALDAMQIWYQQQILCSNHQTLLQRCHLHPMTILQIIDFVEPVGEWL